MEGGASGNRVKQEGSIIRGTDRKGRTVLYLSLKSEAHTQWNVCASEVMADGLVWTAWPGEPKPHAQPKDAKPIWHVFSGAPSN